MVRLCERPGCSEPAAVACGMVPEDLLFWIAPIDAETATERGRLCRRHADAMVVPRGWTLDDRREPVPRLFMPRRNDVPVDDGANRRHDRRRRRRDAEAGEQLQIDGTGEIPRPDPPPDPVDGAAAAVASPESVPDASTPDGAPWRPSFDQDDDLDGLLEVDSPLLARAFRGTGRPRG